MTRPSFDPGEPFSPAEVSPGLARVTSHQTVKLTRGKHTSPEHGACVMELASMLAGEPFSDTPASVCPVIGSFLRAYNDAIDDDRRQDLYQYASKVVGSHASETVQQARNKCLAAWAAERSRLPRMRLFGRSASRRLRLDRIPPFQTPGVQAVHAIRRHTNETHAEALALIDELLALDPEEPTSPATDTERSATRSGQAVARRADPAERSVQERATTAVLRRRHAVT